MIAIMLMGKEKAIMELVTKSKEVEAVDAAIRALGDWEDKNGD